MAVLTPDGETSDLFERARGLVHDGRSPDEICAALPAPGGDESDAALWLYTWALAQQRDERPPPRAALPRVSSS